MGCPVLKVILSMISQGRPCNKAHGKVWMRTLVCASLQVASGRDFETSRPGKSGEGATWTRTSASTNDVSRLQLASPLSRDTSAPASSDWPVLTAAWKRRAFAGQKHLAAQTNHLLRPATIGALSASATSPPLHPSGEKSTTLTFNSHKEQERVVYLSVEEGLRGPICIRISTFRQLLDLYRSLLQPDLHHTSPLFPISLRKLNLPTNIPYRRLTRPDTLRKCDSGLIERAKICIATTVIVLFGGTTAGRSLLLTTMNPHC